jgi:dTDP-glucose 4,6-dehydratase
MILVTGGAGFIGANFVLDWLAAHHEPVVNLDRLTYAGNRQNLEALEGDARHVFVQGDIGDSALVERLLAEHRPRAVVNFAAESHVDRSIHGPEDFIQTNIVGTFRLLEAVRAYAGARNKGQGSSGEREFRFLHVSTDEVYGTLGKDDPPFAETNRYGITGVRSKLNATTLYTLSMSALEGLIMRRLGKLGVWGTCQYCYCLIWSCWYAWRGVLCT